MKNILYRLCSNIKNYKKVKKHVLLEKSSNVSKKLLNILWDKNYILSYVFYKKKLKINFKSNAKNNNLLLISKPSKRIFFNLHKLTNLNSNKFCLFSTNRGFKSLIECKMSKIGGELILIIN